MCSQFWCLRSFIVLKMLRIPLVKLLLIEWKSSSVEPCLLLFILRTNMNNLYKYKWYPWYVVERIIQIVENGRVSIAIHEHTKTSRASLVLLGMRSRSTSPQHHLPSTHIHQPFFTLHSWPRSPPNLFASTPSTPHPLSSPTTALRSFHHPQPVYLRNAYNSSKLALFFLRTYTPEKGRKAFTANKVCC